MIAKHVVVHGRVQGVGYRDSMVDAAVELGIAGWVRNRRDGAVEAHVQGEAGAVERLVAWCHRGPPLARVLSVSTLPLAVDGALAGFARRSTE